MPVLPVPVPDYTRQLYNKVHQAIALASPTIGRDFNVRIIPDSVGGVKVRLVPKNELGMMFCEYLTKNFEQYFNSKDEFKLEGETNDG